MKLKKILKEVDKVRKIDHELGLMFRETYYDDTIGVMFQAYLDARLACIVGIDFNEWCQKVGNAKDKNGAFIVDELFTSVLYGEKNHKEIKKLVDLGWDKIYNESYEDWIKKTEKK